MKGTIWIFNRHGMPPAFEPRVRNIKFSKVFQENGYSVTMFTASTLHNMSINLIDGRERYIEREYDEYRYIHIRTTNYKGNGLKRVWAMLQYNMGLLRVALKSSDKPRIIISSLGITGFFIPFVIAKRHKCPTIVEIRDLWPESIIEFAGLRRNSLLAKLLFSIERCVYQKADAIVFAKEGEVEYIREKGWDLESGGSIDMQKVFYVNNGVDIKEFDTNKEQYWFPDEHLDDDSKFCLVYAGAVRTANAVGRLVDAAKILKERGYENVYILVFGDGTELSELTERSQSLELNNIIFKGNIEKKYMPSVLSRAHATILNYKPCGIWKRGNSSNKLFEYMAAGKPVISTVMMGYDIISKYECGFSVEKETDEGIADAIVKVYELPQQDYERLCKNARRGAEDFDWEIQGQKMLDIFNML